MRAKTYSYLIDDGSKDIKAKGTIKCVIKRKLKFENYKNYTEVNQFHNKINLEKMELGKSVSFVTIENIKNSLETKK